jgi:hypothetical protein
MSLALLIASLVSAALGSLPNLPKNFIAALGAITATLGVLIKSGIGTAGTPTTITLVISTLQAVIAELKAQPGLSQEVLDDIAVLSDALAAAIAANSITAVDPTKLNPITPVA